jgi:hypothetical protein
VLATIQVGRTVKVTKGSSFTICSELLGTRYVEIDLAEEKGLMNQTKYKKELRNYYLTRPTMTFGTIIVFIYSTALIASLVISIKQAQLLQHFTRNIRITGKDLCKFYWPFWKKETLKSQYAANQNEEAQVDRILKLRTINSIIIFPVLLSWTIIVLLFVLAR